VSGEGRVRVVEDAAADMFTRETANKGGVQQRARASVDKKKLSRCSQAPAKKKHSRADNTQC
jgi:hypothetical protein